jgi:hypothetical protein
MQCKGITSELIEQLKDIAGKENVLIEEEERVRYSWDETCRPRPCLPDVVVKPRDTDTVAKVMRLANERIIPVTPRGSGTGLCGGAVPIFGGILISLELMNRILEIDERSFVAVVRSWCDSGRSSSRRGKSRPLLSALSGGGKRQHRGQCSHKCRGADSGEIWGDQELRFRAGGSASYRRGDTDWGQIR